MKTCEDDTKSLFTLVMVSGRSELPSNLEPSNETTPLTRSLGRGGWIRGSPQLSTPETRPPL